MIVRRRETKSVCQTHVSVIHFILPASLPANKMERRTVPVMIPAPTKESEKASAHGMRFGNTGTHTSRTIMLAELTELLAAVPPSSDRDAYAAAINDDNALGKQTASTRRLTNQRLGELYGLDRRVPVFRVLRRLWDVDEPGRPVLAMLCALARDPLLRASASSVLLLADGQELVRASLVENIRETTGSRLNDSILDKVARNAASSWAQSGHLEGRVRKVRRRVTATPGAAAFAFWLGSLEGLTGEQLITTLWASVLDGNRRTLTDCAVRARQLGLIHARVGGQVIEIDPSCLGETAEAH